MLKEDIENSIRAALNANVGCWRMYAGEHGERLTQRLSRQHEVSHTLLASSGTAALEIALRAAGVGAGDKVLLSAYDYPGNFWAIERVGALPCLVDVEPEGWQLNSEQLKQAFGGQEVYKALVASHLHGELQSAQHLRQCCDEKDMLFIEDCCQSLGAEYASGVCGSFGHMSIISFGGGKLLSAGRGGALLTDDETLWQKAKLASGAGSGPYALSELQAAVVLAQLEWLDELRQHCNRYFDSLVRELQSRLEQQGKRWTMPGRSWLASGAASLYQAGWLLNPTPASGLGEAAEFTPAEVIAELTTLLPTVPVGTGFVGFHRRSKRRCRQLGELHNVRQQAERTLVIHHRIALEAQTEPEELADLIAQAAVNASRKA